MSLNRPIDWLIPIPSLLESTFEKLDIRTVGDLLRLKSEIQNVRGVGEKKIAAFRELVAEVELLLETQDGANGQGADASEAPLSFIPSLIANKLSSMGVTSIEALLAIDPRRINKDNMGWGDKSIKKLAALQLFYFELSNISDDGESINYPISDRPIFYIDFSERTGGCLNEAGLTTIGQLQKISEAALLALPNFGEACLAELHSRLTLFSTLYTSYRLEDSIWWPVLVPSPFKSMEFTELERYDVSQWTGSAGPADEINSFCRTVTSFIPSLIQHENSVPSHSLVPESVSLSEPWCVFPLELDISDYSLLKKSSITTLGELCTLASTGRFIEGDKVVKVSLFSKAFSKNLTQRLGELVPLENGMCYFRGLPAEFRCGLLMGILPIRAKALCKNLNLTTLLELDRFLVARCHYDAVQNRYLGPGEIGNFSEASLNKLIKVVQQYSKTGWNQILYGSSTPPTNAKELTAAVYRTLDEKQLELLELRVAGKTLDEIGQSAGLTRERIRQLLNKLSEDLPQFISIAISLCERVIKGILGKSLPDKHQVFSLIGAESETDLDLTAFLANASFYWIDGKLSVLSSNQLSELARQLFKLPEEQTTRLFANGTATITEIKSQVNSKGVDKNVPDTILGYPIEVDVSWLIQTRSVQPLLRKQVVEAGASGIFPHELSLWGQEVDVEDAGEFFDGDEFKYTQDGRIVRSGQVYDIGRQVENLLRSQEQPMRGEELRQLAAPHLPQGPFTGKYLTKMWTVVSSEKGFYTHIENYGLTYSNAKAIAAWGARELSESDGLMTGEQLLIEYHQSDLPYSLDNPDVLLSIVSKHDQVRRPSAKLEIGHVDRQLDNELSLAATFPEIAAQFHPDKNGEDTAETVRPMSNKLYWFKCEKGHEFQRMMSQMTLGLTTCPGCQERWNLSKIRYFISSLKEHLDSLTPAELWTIFQQTGLLDKGGKAKGFVKALTTGRFPKEELDKFCNEEESLVDSFIDDRDFSLPDHESESIGDDSDVIDISEEESNAETSVTPEDLPTVKTKDAIQALEKHISASTDHEAVSFLVESAKAKVWKHAYLDEESALQEARDEGASEYTRKVCEEFIEEYQSAIELPIPNGYAFRIAGELCEPNLMQRHVASQVKHRRRFGNWSGTGAGKTLSAILASRVIDARLTVICCPNSVVGNENSGWIGEIKRIFPDSEVLSKTLEPQWTNSSLHKYLVLNFEQFQQGHSEDSVIHFLSNNEIDFVVIDEIHFAKQRHQEMMSKRKRLVEALVASASATNPKLAVLGMSATPVINNLQEGKSLIEMVTGVRCNDLDVKPTVPNCMKVHQNLVQLGTRWKPNYSATLQTRILEVDCSSYTDRIIELGKRHSPLDIEVILTEARLPTILEYLDHERPTLIYTHYVDRIAKQLYDQISAAGFRVGFYTGESKEGLQQFKDGQLDVLIGSSSIGTGVDGLQHVCDKLIINSLPWTNAEYEQLIGRVWRQGQSNDQVEVIIPATYAIVNGTRWSYCESKLGRISYKKSIADACVDGVVPEGNLRSPGQAQKDLILWLERLRDEDLSPIAREKITVPLSGSPAEHANRLARYGDFSSMNRTWNQTNSSNLSLKLKDNPEEWAQYHSLYKEARKGWTVVPFEEMIKWCDSRADYVIGDFGCGEAKLAEAMQEKHIIHSFDHVAINDSVTSVDLRALPLDDNVLDVAIFCLSLMGSNFQEYLEEAHRTLRIDGQLHIWEASSRFSDIKTFCNELAKLGFQTFEPKQKGKFLHIEARKTTVAPKLAKITF